MIPGDQFLKSFLAFVLAVNGGHDLDGSRRIGNQKKYMYLVSFPSTQHHLCWDLSSLSVEFF